jgi:hypothetical protein
MKYLNFRRTIVNVLLMTTTLFIVLEVQGQVPKWYVNASKIKIFESTRKEVESIFNKFDIKYQRRFRRGETVEYEHRGDKIRVEYSTGKCTGLYEGLETLGINDFKYDGYDLEDGIVLSVYYQPKKMDVFSKFEVDISKYAYAKSHDTEHYFYANWELGIHFTLVRNKVTDVSFERPKRFAYLRCKTNL